MENRDALLTEYQACQHHNSSSALSYWTLTGIFIGFSSALLGGLIYGILSNDRLLRTLFGATFGSLYKEYLILGIIMVFISTAVLIIFYFLKGWLRRYRLLAQLKFKRMREIELKLGLQANLRIQSIDDWNKLKAELEDGLEKKLINNAEKENLEKELEEFRKKWSNEHPKDYERPTGEWHHRWIFYTLIGLWALVLIGSMILLYFYHYIAIIVALILIALIWLTILTH